MQQRGIYIDLLAFSQCENGRGLPNDVEKVAHMIFPFIKNQKKQTELFQDLQYVIKNKFVVKNNRLFNERQHAEFKKGLDLSNKRSLARKKGLVKVLSQQNANNTDDYDNDYDNEDYINKFETMWKEISPKIRKRSSKPKAKQKFLRLSNDNKDKVLSTFPVYHEEQGEFTKALDRFIANEMYQEIPQPLTLEQEREEKQKESDYLLKSRYDLYLKTGKSFNLSAQDIKEAEKKFGKEKKEE